MRFEFKLPDIGEGVVEGEIVRWLIQEGDDLEEDQPMVEIMTDKATVEIPSPVQGRVLERLGQEGDTVDVGSTLVVIDTADARPPVIPSAAREESSAPSAPAAAPDRRRPASEQVLATPAVRKLARERGVDLREVSGTGPGGRITHEDLERAAARPAITAARKPSPVPSPAQRSGGLVEKMPYRGLRRKIGERMRLSKSSIPHYTYLEEADVSELVELRRQFQSRAQDDAPNLTFLPFLIKAVVQGLKKHPLVNASLDEEESVILVKKYYNVGVAVATQEGLVVPVVKEADRKSLLELAAEVARLSQRARDNELSLDELRDGTFTITSLGALGGLMATPVINHPEVAILGVHKIAQRPVVRNGQIVIGEVMNLSLSLDHRVIDGVVGAQFLREVITCLEHPGLLLLT